LRLDSLLPDWSRDRRSVCFGSLVVDFSRDAGTRFWGWSERYSTTIKYSAIITACLSKEDSTCSPCRTDNVHVVSEVAFMIVNSQRSKIMREGRMFHPGSTALL
jgi:hypothetical protein